MGLQKGDRTDMWTEWTVGANTRRSHSHACEKDLEVTMRENEKGRKAGKIKGLAGDMNKIYLDEQDGVKLYCNLKMQNRTLHLEEWLKFKERYDQTSCYLVALCCGIIEAI